MKTGKKILGLTFSITFLIFNIKVIQANPFEQNVTEVVNHLVGVMDTSQQAEENPDAPNVRMTTCMIQVSGVENRVGSVYLYQEQALSNNLEQPYRQRFFRDYAYRR